MHYLILAHLVILLVTEATLNIFQVLKAEKTHHFVLNKSCQCNLPKFLFKCYVLKVLKSDKRVFLIKKVWICNAYFLDLSFKILIIFFLDISKMDYFLQHYNKSNFITIKKDTFVCVSCICPFFQYLILFPIKRYMCRLI